MDDILNRLRTALGWVTQVRDNPSVAQLPVDSLATTGQLLWDISATARRALEPIKERMRQVALEQAEDGTGTFKYWAIRHQGHCLVTAPPPKVTLQDGVSLDDLNGMLGGTLDTYFTVHVQPRADFLEQAEQADETTRAALLSVVDLDTDKPRVSFEDRSRGS